MKRRQFLAVLMSTIPVTGCTGGRDDPLVTMLGHNKDDSSHSVTVWVVQEKTLKISNTVDIASNDFKEIGELIWQKGQYQVTVQVDGEPVLAREFQIDDHFNQLDIVISSDGSVEMNRATAA